MERMCSTGVDFVLGGHEHSILLTENAMISGSDFRHIGVLDMTLAADGKASFQARHVDVTRDIEPSPAMVKILDEVKASIGPKMSKRLAYTTTAIDTTERSCRGGESNIGSFLCDLCRTVLGTDVSIMNGGTIRSNTIYPPGKFTMLQLTQILPFSDPIVVIRATGDEIRQAIELGPCSCFVDCLCFALSLTFRSRQAFRSIPI
jgi:5'-nucleotidase